MPPKNADAGTAIPESLQELQGVAVAGPVSDEEEMLNVQQIATVATWMKFFSAIAPPRRRAQCSNPRR